MAQTLEGEVGPALQRPDALFQSGVQRRSTLVVGEEADARTLGRLHAARAVEIDLPGLARLVDISKANRTAQPWTIDGDAFVSFRGGMRPVFHHGDLHVRGSLLIDENAWLIVTGDLLVDGIVSDYQHCTLAVGGNVYARRLVTSGSLVTLGSVEISDVGLAREESILQIGHALRSPLFLHYRSEIKTGSGVEVIESVDLGDAARIAALLPRFAPDVVSPSGAVDPDRCERLLRCGLTVL